MANLYGVFREGFRRPTVQQIKEEIERDVLASIDPTLDVATDPVIGQYNGIIANQLGKAWEALEETYNGNDPDRAEDDQLISISKLAGTSRRSARYSEVDCTCGFASDGVLIQSGIHFANVLGRPDLRWTPRDDFTAPSPGNHTVRFRAEFTGPVLARAGTITVIATSVVGWDSVTNPLGATPGRDIESIADLRLRRAIEITTTGAATVAAIRAAVSAIEDVAQVRVFENRTPSFNGFGLPPHSFEVVVFGDGADDDEIAQAIWDAKAAGIRDFGTGPGATTGTAVDDLGDEQTVHFSRAEPLAIYLSYELEVTPDFVGDATLKLIIATLANELYDINETVVASFLRSLPFQKQITLPDGAVYETLGVRDVVGFAIGLGSAPTETVNIPVNQRQIARFDTSRITVTVL